MGLFRKKPPPEDPTVPLQAEIDALRQRLDAADQAKSALEQRIAGLAETNDALNARVGNLDKANHHFVARLEMLDDVSSRLDRQLDTLRTTSDDLHERVEVVDSLSAHVRQLAERVTAAEAAPATIPAPTSAPPPPPPSVPPPPPADALRGAALDDGRLTDMGNQLEDLSAAVASHQTQLAAAKERMSEVDELAGLLGGLVERDELATTELAELRERLGEITERMNSLDGRVTSVSTELANQLTELSRDIDELNEQAAASADDDSEAATGSAPGAGIDADELEARLGERIDTAIGDVLESTEKLAAEQARYEIKFREDLAELAERLRRPGHT
jgi:chromosome segregation ATPase